MCMCIGLTRALSFSFGLTRGSDPHLGLYHILFHFKACMWESIILLLPPPTCISRTIAILLHVYCAMHDAPPTLLLHAIYHTILVIAISCKSQSAPDMLNMRSKE